ncbi:MAG: hypothetical protein U1F34_06105 [Gammaproteobacteria bacterium]
MTAKTIYVAVTFHGYGHVAQTAPVVNELVTRQPDLRVVIECVAPVELLRKHFHMSFEHVPIASDFGMVMHDSLAVDLQASHERYLAQLSRWEEEIVQSMQRMVAFRPGLVFGNVPYVPLLAAKRMGIPAMAMCSLNWAEIYHGYCHDLPGAARVYVQLCQAYDSVDAFIAPTPSMPMPKVSKLVSVGPIARRGISKRDEIRTRLALDDNSRIVAVFMGGVRTELPLDLWPRRADIHWLIAGSSCPAREDMTPIERIDFSYIDIVCSCDALITKPGYGGFVEAACNGIPVLYVPREVWPEAPHLVAWLECEARCLRLEKHDLEHGNILPPLEALWALPKRPIVAPSGIDETASILQERLKN